MSIERKQTVVLIARQIAIHNGYTWQLVPTSSGQIKAQDKYRTLAESILATVERAAAVRWSV